MTANFAAALARTATVTPTKLAVVDDVARCTYAQLDDLVDRVAAGLLERGVGPGDAVTSQLPNSIEAVALCLAANRIGAIHNPIVTIYRDHEVSFIREEAASAVFIDRRDDDLFGYDTATRVTAAAVEPHAPHFLVYTSGSTSRPKGVLHSDRTLTAECAAQGTYHRLTENEVFVMAGSVGHVSGLIYGVLLPIWLGATTVLMSTWDPERFLALVDAEGGTFSGGAPAFLQGLVDHSDLARFDLSSLRAFPCGGADVAPNLMRQASQRLGVRTGRGYGSTEFPSITSSAGFDETDSARAETDGRPIGDNEVRIVDGEIQARGPELFLGYRDPTLDAEAFTPDGWFRTGDLGVLDDAGYLRVIGRLKDIIVRSGEKISARELEDLLTQHPKVAAVAVIAQPDPRTGERVCACVMASDPRNEPSLPELAAFLADRGLSRRKLPEQLELVAAMPMTDGGKIDKQTLRARYRQPHSGGRLSR